MAGSGDVKKKKNRTKINNFRTDEVTGHESLQLLKCYQSITGIQI